MGADLRPWRPVNACTKLKGVRNMQEYCRNAENTTMICRVKVVGNEWDKLAIQGNIIILFSTVVSH